MWGQISPWPARKVTAVNKKCYGCSTRRNSRKLIHRRGQLQLQLQLLILARRHSFTTTVQNWADVIANGKMFREGADVWGSACISV